jgi:hypothetical protein
MAYVRDGVRLGESTSRASPGPSAWGAAIAAGSASEAGMGPGAAISTWKLRQPGGASDGTAAEGEPTR